MQVLLSINGEEKSISLNNEESIFEICVDKNVSSSVILNISLSVKSAEINTKIEEGGSLNILCLHAGGKNQKVIQKNIIKAGATLYCQNVSLSREVNHEILSNINGEGASSSVDFISYAKGNEKQNIFVKNIFNSKKGRGEINLKSVAEDEASVVCNGTIEIGESGGGTDAYLTENVLMLDPQCIVDAIPALEIRTNDVKASHSATVSRVTQEDIFTFASRGISPKDARKMYVLGFLEGSFEKIENTSFRENCILRLTEKYEEINNEVHYMKT